MLGIDPKEAKTYIDAFYEAYPKVRTFYDELLEKARID